MLLGSIPKKKEVQIVDAGQQKYFDNRNEKGKAKIDGMKIQASLPERHDMSKNPPKAGKAADPGSEKQNMVKTILQTIIHINKITTNWLKQNQKKHCQNKKLRYFWSTSYWMTSYLMSIWTYLRILK